MNSQLIKILLTVIVGFTAVTAQNFSYVEGDWDIKTTPKMINAITENTWDVYFATNDGIYMWDKMNNYISYNFTLSNYLGSKNIYHLFYDLNTDFFWAVHEDGISYKPAIGTYWTDISLPVNPGNVNDIGSTDGLIWIDYRGKFISLDAFSGTDVTPDKFVNTDFIQWGNSRFGRGGDQLNDTDNYLNDYFASDSEGYSFYDPARATLSMTDSNGNQWIGTNKGYVIRKERNNSYGEKIYLGSPLGHVTTLYYDQYHNWWMGDNQFKRTGQIPGIRKQEKFLFRWNETSGRWTNYSTKYINDIEDKNINCILRVNYYLYVGTLKGLLILSVADDRWETVSEGLADPSVWDMVEKGGKLYLATARGIQVMSIPGNALDKDQPVVFKRFNNSEIFDLDIKGDNLYIASEKGVAVINLSTKKRTIITSEPFKSLSAQGNQLILAKKGLLKVNKDGKLENIYNDDVFKFAVNGKFVWLTDMKDAILLDMKTGKKMRYSSEDGIPGTTIYDINCDDNWVWFGTDEGIAIYNWSRYHQ